MLLFTNHTDLETTLENRLLVDTGSPLHKLHGERGVKCVRRVKSDANAFF